MCVSINDGNNSIKILAAISLSKQLLRMAGKQINDVPSTQTKLFLFCSFYDIFLRILEGKRVK